MNSSRRKTREAEDPLRFFSRPVLQSPTLVVGWSEDAGQLGPKVIDYLRRKLDSHNFGEIEPAAFFSMGGVAVENNVVKFPESRFYASPERDLVLFESALPTYEWYRFLNLIADVAEYYCHVREVLTIGGMVAICAHTTPRQLVATFSSSEAKAALSIDNLVVTYDYETSAGQKPTLSSYLLWVAKTRNIPAASLWVPIPFYLAGSEDPSAEKAVLQFIDRRLGLGLDLRDLDEAIRRQNEELARARSSKSHIDEAFAKLEGNQSLSEEESLRLVEEVEQFLRRKEA